MSHPSYEIIKELQFALRYTRRIKKAPGQELKHSRVKKPGGITTRQRVGAGWRGGVCVWGGRGGCGWERIAKEVCVKSIEWRSRGRIWLRVNYLLSKGLGVTDRAF